MLISCLYNNLIEGTLDQRTLTCYITSTVGRDVTNDQLDNILAVLSAWQANIATTLNDLDKEMREIIQTNLNKETKENNFQKKLKEKMQDTFRREQQHNRLRMDISNVRMLKTELGGGGNTMNDDIDQLQMENLLASSSLASLVNNPGNTIFPNSEYSAEQLNRLLGSERTVNDNQDTNNRQVKRERRNDHHPTSSLENLTTTSSSSTTGSSSNMDITE